ncbi:MAG: MarR family transcriptional regulator [Chloroflexi bacterium]|jgi:DNA-binding MarR family transcriptional regulator|nr:MarR family transcriptional regulator [Chloroflexota bacterium]
MASRPAPSDPATPRPAGRRPRPAPSARRTPLARHPAEELYEELSDAVESAGRRVQDPREISGRIAMGRALWRELVIGFAVQLGELRLGFTQLAALYVLSDARTLTVAELAEAIGRSPSATSRLVDGLAGRSRVERTTDSADRRQRSVALTRRGRLLVAVVDRARAAQFLGVVRPLPPAERAVVAMAVAALATRAVTRRGRLIKAAEGGPGRA